MLDSTDLIREFVRIPGPPGQEQAVADAFSARAASLGYRAVTDPKGNVTVTIPGTGKKERPKVVVTAHLDEIALMVQRIHTDGLIDVIPLGGAYPWKWGEQPVQILSSDGPIDGLLSFGSIHTNAPESVAQQARTGPLVWSQARVFTPYGASRLWSRGVRPGVRIVLHPDVRQVREMGAYLCSYFLDDRADLAAMLLAMETLAEEKLPVMFAATTSEEVGAEGAAYLLHRLQPDVCVALEIGPSVPESAFEVNDQPTIWVTDSYASIHSDDQRILMETCRELGQEPHWQPLSRGGSDASSAAQRGLAARPVTLGLPVENSHGLEIMHRDAPAELARLLAAYLRKVTA
jgi:putative aminopeptidase FrvX